MYPTTHNLTTRPPHKHVYALVTSFLNIYELRWPGKECPQNLLRDRAADSPKRTKYRNACGAVQVTSVLALGVYIPMYGCVIGSVGGCWGMGGEMVLLVA